MYITMDTKTRRYDMRARNESTAATRDAIVAAAIDAVTAERSLGITLGSVAERAGVTVKTVLRHFGSRESLIEAAYLAVRQAVVAERVPPPGDVEAAMTALIEHYEGRGDMVLGLLAEEDDDPRARLMCEGGRALHRKWVEDVFATELSVDPNQRDRIVDTLVVATDVYSWKLLRRDRNLTVAEVRDRMLLMIDGVLAVSQGADARTAL